MSHSPISDPAPAGLKVIVPVIVQAPTPTASAAGAGATTAARIRPASTPTERLTARAPCSKGRFRRSLPRIAVLSTTARPGPESLHTAVTGAGGVPRLPEEAGEPGQVGEPVGPDQDGAHAPVGSGPGQGSGGETARFDPQDRGIDEVVGCSPPRPP